MVTSIQHVIVHQYALLFITRLAFPYLVVIVAITVEVVIIMANTVAVTDFVVIEVV